MHTPFYIIFCIFCCCCLTESSAKEDYVSRRNIKFHKKCSDTFTIACLFVVIVCKMRATKKCWCSYNFHNFCNRAIHQVKSCEFLTHHCALPSLCSPSIWQTMTCKCNLIHVKPHFILICLLSCRLITINDNKFFVLRPRVKTTWARKFVFFAFCTFSFFYLYILLALKFRLFRVRHATHNLSNAEKLSLTLFVSQNSSLGECEKSSLLRCPQVNVQGGMSQ